MKFNRKGIISEIAALLAALTDSQLEAVRAFVRRLALNNRAKK